MDQMGKIPREGECFRYENLDIMVTRTEDLRVMSVQVKRNESPDAVP